MNSVYHRSALLGMLLLASGGAGAAGDDGYTARSTAPAQAPMQGGSAVFKPTRLDFRFGETTATLGRDGVWRIEGPVKHRGLLCGTYELGLRFGAGKGGCTDVAWIGEAVFVSREKQCNDAVLRHAGGADDAALAQSFDAITCAERALRCSGNCK